MAARIIPRHESPGAFPTCGSARVSLSSSIDRPEAISLTGNRSAEPRSNLAETKETGDRLLENYLSRRSGKTLRNASLRNLSRDTRGNGVAIRRSFHSGTLNSRLRYRDYFRSPRTRAERRNGALSRFLSRLNFITPPPLDRLCSRESCCATARANVIEHLTEDLDERH